MCPLPLVHASPSIRFSTVFDTVSDIVSDIVYTIGHSTHPAAQFIDLLRLHGVTAVCDVRSRPYSRFNPQFNRETLHASLREAGVAYSFLGRELGVRSDDPACYERDPISGSERVRYERLARTALFRAGLDRLRAGMQTYRVALMCAEKEPLECHRTILVVRQLIACGPSVDVRHIHADGRLERHEDALERLVRMLALPAASLVHSREELFVEAYRRQGARMAYERRPSRVDASGSETERAD